MKQRLIDVNNNNLRDAIWKAKLDTREKVDGLLDCAPTVDAIPIKWLNKWFEKNDKFYAIMLLMMKDWEKENGTGN